MASTHPHTPPQASGGILRAFGRLCVVPLTPDYTYFCTSPPLHSHPPPTPAVIGPARPRACGRTHTLPHTYTHRTHSVGTIGQPPGPSTSPPTVVNYAIPHRACIFLPAPTTRPTTSSLCARDNKLNLLLLSTHCVRYIYIYIYICTGRTRPLQYY